MTLPRTQRRLPVVCVALTGLVAFAGAAQGGAGASVSDPRGDTALPSTAAPELFSDSVDLQRVTVSTRAGRDRLGLVVTLATVSQPRPGLPVAYRVDLLIDGCSLLLSAQGDQGRGRALIDCENREVHDLPLRISGTTIRWDVPATALPTRARSGSEITQLHSRSVLTEGHDRYDASVLDEASAAVNVRL